MAGFSTTMIVAETIRRVGTREQRERLLPRVLAGDIVFALGYSEPGAGSDVASVRTRADRRDDGRWVINGQKAFTTTAEEAEYVFVLARTNCAVPRHRGLTLFLVPTSAGGFSISPVRTLGGERSNMTFYEDLVVSDDARVGDIDAGWQTMMIALDFERGGEFAAEMQRLVDLVTAWALEQPQQLPAATLRRIGRAVAHTEAAKLLGAKATALRAERRPANLEGTMAKLYATEALQHHASALLDALGPAGALQEGAPAAPRAGGIEAMYRHSIVTTIYAGTSEVLRGVIAGRWLKLPRVGRD
jgi:alkylation response protein AidB-like acyl-CoA dehydrogenase